MMIDRFVQKTIMFSLKKKNSDKKKEEIYIALKYGK